MLLIGFSVFLLPTFFHFSVSLKDEKLEKNWKKTHFLPKNAVFVQKMNKFQSF